MPGRNLDAMEVPSLVPKEVDRKYGRAAMSRVTAKAKPPNVFAILATASGHPCNPDDDPFTYARALGLSLGW